MKKDHDEQRGKHLIGKEEQGPPPPVPDDIANAAVREIWRLYQAARRGRMDVQKACRLTYMLTALGKLHELSQLEKRLRALEMERSAK